jgi:hypothetical protein
LDINKVYHIIDSTRRFFGLIIFTENANMAKTLYRGIEPLATQAAGEK